MSVMYFGISICYSNNMIIKFEHLYNGTSLQLSNMFKCSDPTPTGKADSCKLQTNQHSLSDIKAYFYYCEKYSAVYNLQNNKKYRHVSLEDLKDKRIEVGSMVQGRYQNKWYVTNNGRVNLSNSKLNRSYRLLT